MKGISVNIFRSDLGDCTNHGATSPARSKGKIVVIFDEAIEGGNYDLEECEGNPRILCLKIVRRWVGRPNEYLHVEPMFDRPSDGVGPMFGGNYVATSDSRLTAVCSYPLPVHDRFETQEQYDAMSR